METAEKKISGLSFSTVLTDWLLGIDTQCYSESMPSIEQGYAILANMSAARLTNLKTDVIIEAENIWLPTVGADFL